MTPRMQTVWNVLEAALDAADPAVVGACRRLIVANRLGWWKHANERDWALVQAFAA